MKIGSVREVTEKISVRLYLVFIHSCNSHNRHPKWCVFQNLSWIRCVDKYRRVVIYILHSYLYVRINWVLMSGSGLQDENCKQIWVKLRIFQSPHRTRFCDVKTLSPASRFGTFSKQLWRRKWKQRHCHVDFWWLCVSYLSGQASPLQTQETLLVNSKHAVFSRLGIDKLSTKLTSIWNDELMMLAA